MKRAHIYYKLEFARPDGTLFETKNISNTYYEIPGETKLKVKNDSLILEYFKRALPQKRIIENIKKELWDFEKKAEIKDVEIVFLKKGKFIPGIYYAHEYDKHVKGKARKLTCSNGFVEYEVICLDKELVVVGPIWEEVTNSGTGDRFDPFEEVK